MKLFYPFYLLVIIIFAFVFCGRTGVKSATFKASSEPYRPKFHFTPPAKWMNDPNGLVFYKGEYHLFYQYFPDSTVWGPMHWGHAVSKDMVHWEHLPIALYPDKIGLIFSGSVVIDEKNTSGFGQKGETPLVSIFTYHNLEGEKAGKIDYETQGIAFSLDNGRTWTKYADNPVIKNPGTRDFRDPKVMWYEPAKQWILTLAVANHVEFFGSKNLKDWKKQGEFGKTEGSHGGVWECPDLFPIKIEGTNTQKWILIQSLGNGAPNGGSGTQYFVGDFDGKSFKNENEAKTILWLDYGRDNYAGVTWFGAPDNRRLFLGWMSNWQYATSVPTKAWRSATTLPRELTLTNTPQGLRLMQRPVKETEALRSATVTVPLTVIKEVQSMETTSAAQEMELIFDLSKTSANDVGVVLSNTKNEKVEIGYNISSKQFYIDRTAAGKMDFSNNFAGRQYAPRQVSNTNLKMHLYIDVASVELFADDGSVAMTSIFFPNEDFNKTQLYAKNGSTQLLQGNYWNLK